MKTPREILLERHRQIEPRLNVVRQKALAALRASRSAGALQPGRRERPLVWAVLSRAWLELIWPSRRAWAAMAVLWLAVLAANLQMKATVGPVPAGRSAPAHEVARAFAEQRRLLAELLPAANSHPAQAPRPSAGPRSERPAVYKAC